MQYNGTVRNSCFPGTEKRTGPARRNSGKFLESICLRSSLAYRFLYFFWVDVFLGSVDKIKDYGQQLKIPFSSSLRPRTKGGRGVVGGRGSCGK